MNHEMRTNIRDAIGSVKPGPTGRLLELELESRVWIFENKFVTFSKNYLEPICHPSFRKRKDIKHKDAGNIAIVEFRDIGKGNAPSDHQ